MALQLSDLKQTFSFRLLLLYICLCSIILLKFYFNLDGYISPDSAYYLDLSNNLTQGEGFEIADYNSPEGRSFFAVWPVGYPVLIFIISKITGLGIVWASKVLNLLIIGIILLLFRYIFKENAHWAGLIFFVDSIVLVFTFTWSEGVFVLFLLCTSISLYKSVKTDGKLIWLVTLFFSGISLFLVRYIGLFSVGIIGFIALLNLINRKYHLSVKLIVISFLQLVFAGLYLYHNKIATGYMTGMQRDLPEESNRELLNQLLSALKDEFILIKCGIPVLLSLGLVALLLIYLFRNRGSGQRKNAAPDLWKYFLLTWIFYFAAIVGAKWFSNFTALDYRYLFPGTFFFILSIAAYLQGKPPVKIMKMPIVFLIVLITLFIHYIPHTNYIKKNISSGFSYFKNPNYEMHARDILDQYKEVEPNSIVIFGPIHLRYLANSIIPTDVYGKNSIEDMTKHFTQLKDWNIYVKIRNDLDPINYHESFIRLMEANSDKKIVKIHDGQ